MTNNKYYYFFILIVISAEAVSDWNAGITGEEYKPICKG